MGECDASGAIECSWGMTFVEHGDDFFGEFVRKCGWFFEFSECGVVVEILGFYEKGNCSCKKMMVAGTAEHTIKIVEKFGKKDFLVVGGRVKCP